MSTWQVFSDAGNDYTWQRSHTNESHKPPLIENPHNLPSIADLLFQGYANLYVDQGVEIETPSAIRTGLGKPVVVKPSSCIAGNNDTGANADTGYANLYEDQCVKIETPPAFRTGLGEPVVVRPSSLVKASCIIGNQDTGANADSGYASLYEDKSVKCETPPAFRTGLGKMAVVKQSSLAKASCIPVNQDIGANADTEYLKVENDSKGIGTPFTFRTGSGKHVAIKQSSMAKALSMFGGEDGDDNAFVETGRFKLCEGNNDKVETLLTFQTGSGKLVAARKSSIEKAFSILGDLDDEDFSGRFKVREDNNDKVETPLTFQTGSGKLVAARKSSIEQACSIFGDQEYEVFSDCTVGPDNGIGCMFTTGSGKAVKICSTGLIKARKLLGFEENSVLDNASKDLEQSRIANAGTSLGFQEPNSSSKFHSGGEIKDRKPPRRPVMRFQTAGGRSVNVSGHALKQARSLLGDPDLGNFFKEGDMLFSSDMNKENNVHTPFSDIISKSKAKTKQMHNNFISPLRSVLSDNKTIGLKNNLIKEFDAVGHESHDIKQYNDNTLSVHKALNRPLVDISNTFGADSKQVTGEKRKLSSRRYPSPFKKPRNSKFIPPLTKNSTLVSSGTMPKISEGSCCKRRVSTRYPFQFAGKYIDEYLGEPPFFQYRFENFPEWLRKINSENAGEHMFEDESGIKCIGLDSLFHMLAQSGCSILSKEWVANHYRGIVWKLACYERSYPAKFSGKLLTISNVLEELKYRYEREVNNAHRSALKRILEGDAPPSSPLILCIASIQLKCDAEPDIEPSNATESLSIELTDGWYSVKAMLDELLLKQLVSGKLFVGQKLRICGASLSGWNAPVSPLEASSKMVSLCLHINGTYRAHWADRLGFCKSGCVPLAFKCIKGSGGVVPSTLVGITRVYPVLYRERLSDGVFVVRSERMENKSMQLHDQRRSSIMEGVMAEFQSGLKSFQIEDDEGEKISKLLEQAAEPEVIMAGMSLEQLTSFATYQAKIEATKQSEIDKLIEKALEDAGLSRREVSTLMRVRVVGLNSQSYVQKSCTQQGLITIWNPTEKQQSELVEGRAYAVAGLTPINSDTNTIYLRARGSTTRWCPLSESTIQQFQPFFTPRKPVSLSQMGEVPLSSEFDVAAFVIYVGLVNKSSQQKRQWVFVTDGSISSHPRQLSLSDSLLAISFCSPSIDCDSIVPINYNLVGSTVGFCNLVKCAKDQTNNWVAEATDNSTYFLSYDGPNSKHLKDAAASADQWAKGSTLMIETLKGKVSSVVAGK
ncbi:protein BREAST CANCER SUSCEPTIBILITY 2 homolog B-like isoform X1 [Bidens hawaiensis]|uniref:protein BREAST CANCER SUSCEPTIBILITY 2 homolog B-like isoform X1 n=1 Tax=Bidens hawaiensis TaxID=980011 RepID=UPI00404A6274